MLELSVQKKLATFPLSVSIASDSRRIGILGSSGCGKSMTLKMIAGVIAPDSGRISLDGQVLYDSATKVHLKSKDRSVGYLFQNYALFPAMTVEQNIAVGVHCSRAERRARVDELIRRFHLDGLERRYPGQISGGQQQRVALARMMASQPRTIMLDEPFSALDVALCEAVQVEMLEFLESFSGQVIMVSHSLDELYRFCDWLAVMERGEILRFGARDEVFRQPQKESVARLLGCQNLIAATCVDAHHLCLPEWGVTLATQWVVPEDCTAVGIRAQALEPVGEQGENCIPVHPLIRAVTPFSCRYQMVPPDNNAAQPIWWESPTGMREAPSFLRLSPQEVLPLTE